MPASKPNLLLFMPETLRADAILGAAGERAVTPNFERLMGDGVTFTQAFAPVALCTPSRICMFTGLYPHTNGHRSIWHLLQKHERNFFQDVKEAGYRTYVFGKNDLIDSSAVEQSIDDLRLRARPDKDSHHSQCRIRPSRYADELGHAYYKGCRESGIFDVDAARVESALRVIEQPSDQPWCIFLPLSCAHPPYLVEEPFFSMHDRADVATSIPYTPEGKRCYVRLLHEFYGDDALNEENTREIKATYLGMVSRADRLLGKILDKLQACGREADTCVVAFSDHGDYAGDYGLVEKSVLGYEDALLRVPLIVRGPGLAQGTSTALCEMTDLYPTLLDLAGIESKHYHFGKSLMPILQGDLERSHREQVFGEGGPLAEEAQFQIQQQVTPGSRAALIRAHPEMYSRIAMVRTRQFKYIYASREHDELYDLKADPQEIQNLASEPTYEDVVAGMREKILQWMLETSDALPLEQGRRAWG